MRAISVRTVRYDSRALRRNHCVTIAISGMTASATRARRQSITNRTMVMPSQHEDVAEDRDDTRGEQVVQHVDVGRDPRHQAADRIAVVEADVEPLQVLVDLHPHVEHDALAGQLQQSRSAGTRA